MFKRPPVVTLADPVLAALSLLLAQGNAHESRFVRCGRVLQGESRPNIVTLEGDDVVVG